MELLDKITMDDGREYLGVTDYVNSKHVYFFDFTNNIDKDFITKVVLWKGYKPNIRFSVFCMINYPNTELPKVILLPNKNILGEKFLPTVINRGRKIKHIFKVESITGSE